MRIETKQKIRLIDEFSESSVSQTVMAYETPVLHTADVVCATITHWFGCASTVGCSKQLVARAFDLSSAYRQVGLCLEGRNMAYIRL